MNKVFFWRGFITGAIAFILVIVLVYNKFVVQPDILLNQIEVQNLSGETVNLDQYIGKPLVVNYWATWCAPCIKEFPYFNEVKQQLEGDVNFLMISDESTKKINTFSTSNPYTFNYLRSNKNLSEYGINARPTTYFYDSNGALVTKHTGELNVKILNKLINKIK